MASNRRRGVGNALAPWTDLGRRLYQRRPDRPAQRIGQISFDWNDTLTTDHALIHQELNSEARSHIADGRRYRANTQGISFGYPPGGPER
jgi:hypothetical protein